MSAQPHATTGPAADPQDGAHRRESATPRRAPRRRTAVAWPDPVPQARPVFPAAPQPEPPAVHAAPVLVPDLPPAAPAPIAPPEPPAAAAPVPAPEPPAASAPPAMPEPATAPVDVAPPAAPEPPAAPVDLAPPVAPAPPVAAPAMRFVPPVAAAHAPAPAPASASAAPAPAPAPAQDEIEPTAGPAPAPAPVAAPPRFVPPAPAARFVPPVATAAPAAPEPPVAAAAPTAPTAPEPPVAPVVPEPPLSTVAAAPTVAPLAPEPPTAPAVGAPHDAAHGGASTAPPGFTGERLRAAESAQLLALDPTFEDDEEAASPAFPAADPVLSAPATAAPHASAAVPAAAPAGPREVGGSRLLGLATEVLPRRGDAQRFGRDRGATARIATGLILASLVLVFVGPLIAKALAGVPILGPALDQLRAITLYPGVYGLPWVTGVLAVLSGCGIIAAHMEQQAHKQGMRQDPVRRLNIALGTLLGVTIPAGLFTTVASHGWAAGTAATGFTAALCLLVPLGRLPGARAMAVQPARAWALLFALSLGSLLLAPTVPALLLVLLTFTHVRMHWGDVSSGADHHAHGPVDGTNRRSALLIVAAVLVTASIGLHTVQQTSKEVEALRDQDQVTRVPGTIPGPTVDELRR